MTTLTPEQAHSVLHKVFAGTLKNESRTTKTILEAVPADQLSYRPDSCAKTADELLRHIATAEFFFLEAVITGAFNPGSVKIPDDATTPALIAAWYGEKFAKDFDIVAKLSGEQLAKIVDFRGLLQMPAVMFLQFGLNHTIHHRGQLSTYLRPMGGKIPAIYGESYDSAQAKKAAQA